VSQPLGAPRLPEMSEHQEQVTLFQWAATQLVPYPELEYLHAVPNGGQRHKAVAGKLKAEGVKPGVPDIFLDVARNGYFGLRLELKRRFDGYPTPAQRVWGAQLERQGYQCVVCRGWEHARDVILEYLRGYPTVAIVP
jgi:hypothetical protein